MLRDCLCYCLWALDLVICQVASGGSRWVWVCMVVGSRLWCGGCFFSGLVDLWVAG